MLTPFSKPARHAGLLMLALAASPWLTPSAAQTTNKKKRKNVQYKRIHQEILRQIVESKENAAAKSIEKTLTEIPDDDINTSYNSAYAKMVAYVAAQSTAGDDYCCPHKPHPDQVPILIEALTQDPTPPQVTSRKRTAAYAPRTFTICSSPPGNDVSAKPLVSSTA